MHWRLKAAVQSAIARLPDPISYALYYQLQRRFGNLRRLNPFPMLEAGREIWMRLVNHGCSPSGKTFFEVGTGRVPLLPIAYWLLGAKSTITVDLNPYLRDELIRECINELVKNQSRVRQALGSHLVEDRLASLCRLGGGEGASRAALLDLCQITYVAPGDAAATGLGENSIDFHTSHTVFEHIPPAVLRGIIIEGNRLLRPTGMFIHRIDYSDHFAHSDPRITRVNFLQYSENEWERLAGNRYMYMNRLRHDDYLRLVHDCGHQVVAALVDTDKRSHEAMSDGSVRPHARFANRSLEALAITAAWLLSKPLQPSLPGRPYPPQH